MKLKIDTTPKLPKLEFITMKRTYAQTSSPRSIVSRSGLEFDHFRPYQGDDDARKIDWISSMRSTETLVRVYREDTSMNILLMLDVSSSMIYGTGKKAKIEQAIEIALNLAYGILAYGDSVGLMIFNDDIVNVVPFDIGQRKFIEIQEALLETSKFDGGYDLEGAFINAMGLFIEAHLVILISDFIGGQKKTLPIIQEVADRFDIIGCMVYDKTDMTLEYPAALMKLRAPYGDGGDLVNAKKMAKKYEEFNKKRVNDMRHFFVDIGKELWTFEANDSIEEKLTQFLMERNSRLQRL